MSSTEILRGKKVIVIGGSSGVGRSIAIAALAHGASVVIASSSSDKVNAAVELLKESSKEPGVSVRGHAFDIEDSAALTSFLTQEGPFDHLAITAGKMPGAMRFPQDEITKEFKGAFERHTRLLQHSLFLAQHIYKNNLIRPGGSITTTTGTSLQRPLPGWALTCGPVGALASVTRGLALDLKPIRCMGLIDTELFNTFPKEARDGLFQSQREVLPVGHVGQPSEAAEAYIFAMKCTYLTGQTITVDGGASLV
ncbi:enoyl-(acyl carrier) reductase [Rhizoctonia solani AG-3 Rhs1AP]|uniref:Enoyl-(Acyl carrier) reductase n=2 Tax=Rhizoctonia solani AG-3 TaxID=1086053 RepID=A0A074S537_9AGAM|nr:enoyl-(acyl carrier) reductase [Rhizoctonia solani AG-3 Rhs1AP]KEP54531.1 enoyl-(acyl carrier) reductase [Rhizoctonia solani 123E]